MADANFAFFVLFLLLPWRSRSRTATCSSRARTSPFLRGRRRSWRRRATRSASPRGSRWRRTCGTSRRWSARWTMRAHRCAAPEPRRVSWRWSWRRWNWVTSSSPWTSISWERWISSRPRCLQWRTATIRCPLPLLLFPHRPVRYTVHLFVPSVIYCEII